MRKAREQRRALKKKVRNSEVLRKVMSKFYEEEAEVGSDHEENDDVVKAIDVKLNWKTRNSRDEGNREMQKMKGKKGT